MVRPLAIHKKKVGFFRFRQNRRGYLITNDLGNFFQLKDSEFRAFVAGSLDRHSTVYAELASRFFIKDDFDFADAVRKYRIRYSYLFRAPVLHIVVVTLRCNFRCGYCQTNRKDPKSKNFDMDMPTARNVVDRIFETPGRQAVIEFQGGEPLLNWPVVRSIIEYARKKNIKNKKDLRFRLVTNLSLMTDRIYAYLVKNRVSICTSLDGPEAIHNANRPYPGHNSYRITAGWIKKIKEKELSRRPGRRGAAVPRLSALLTVSRRSLAQLPRIIDEYVALGFEAIHIRKLSCLGLSGKAATGAGGYTAEEFIAAWKKAMDHILRLNAGGTVFCEKMTLLLLRKIFSPREPGYLDLRSPCGAGAGQIAYDYNGKVYTCDEARMLEDGAFLLGDANTGDYRAIASSPMMQNVLSSSLLEGFVCDECAYKPYCGICPVANYALQGTVFPHIPCTDSCKVNSAMLDYIFDKLPDKDARDIFHMWLGRF